MGTSCDGNTEGTIRYNSTSKKMEYCDGSDWKSVGAGTQATIAIGPPSSSLVKGGPVDYVISYGSGTDSNGITLASGDIVFGGTATNGCAASISGSGLTRTVTVNGCTATGTVNISLAASTASSTTGDAAPSAGPSTNFNADNTGPTEVTGVTIGSIPANLTSSPTISYSPATDLGGSTVANHQVQLVKTSDGSVFYAWANHTGGTAVTGMTVPPNTEFAIYVRAVDAFGNVGAPLIPVFFTSLNRVPGSQTFTYTGGVQTFVVPDGCSAVLVKVWGAGGGGGAAGNNGGVPNAAGGGGGGSSILRGISVLAAAGGGGGGGNYLDGGAVPHAGAGGTTGANGINANGTGSAAGGANSNVSGGAAGIGYNSYIGTAGTLGQGGAGASGNGRNGGGGWSGASGSGGGGGSSYATGTGISYLNGSSKIPGGTADAAYVAGVGVGVGGGGSPVGGGSTPNSPGGNGLIVISYQP